VNLHPNARTTPYTREMLVDRIEWLGWAVSDAAQAAGVSERTVYRWLARFRSKGPESLRDRHSRPRRRTGRGPTRHPARLYSQL
jgi:transposase